MRIDSPDRRASVAVFEVREGTTYEVGNFKALVLGAITATAIAFDDGLIRKLLCMFVVHALTSVPAERWSRDIAHRMTSYSEASRLPE